MRWVSPADLAGVAPENVVKRNENLALRLWNKQSTQAYLPGVVPSTGKIAWGFNPACDTIQPIMVSVELAIGMLEGMPTMDTTVSTMSV